MSEALAVVMIVIGAIPLVLLIQSVYRDAPRVFLGAVGITALFIASLALVFGGVTWLASSGALEFFGGAR